MVIFALQITNSSSATNYVIYFKNKPSTPHICWNSCIPTSITPNSYSRYLNYPIIATEAIVYIYGANSNVNVDFLTLP